MTVTKASTKILLPIVASVTLVGGSNRQMYEGFQASQRTNCLSLPPEKYDDCMEKANISFETYRRQRAEAKQ